MYFQIIIFSEIRTCLRNKPLAIVGDSRLRNIYHLLVDKLEAKEIRVDDNHGKIVCFLK